jgi:hypothetical protein
MDGRSRTLSVESFDNVLNWAVDLEDEARQQAIRSAAMPFVEKPLALMPTHELIVKHNSGGVEIDLGDDEILSIDFPRIIISNESHNRDFPPDRLMSLEGEIIGRSFHDLTLDRVAIIDWTVYSDDWDHEQWTVLSWVIARKDSNDEKRYIKDGIDIMENTKRILEESLNVRN